MTSLNAKKLPSNSSGPRPDPVEPGSYPARLAQIILLGTQKQRPFKGEEKPPALEIMLTYELLDEFMKDEDGEDILDKPRWISETLSFLSLKADRAKSTKRYYALDPEDNADGDWSQLLGAPCIVTIVNEKDKRPGMDRIYENVDGVSAMRPKEAAKAAQLKNKGRIFDFYSPDMEVFNDLPEWIQDKMKSALDFEGSALDLALGSKDAPKKEKKVVKIKDEEVEDDEEKDW